MEFRLLGPVELWAEGQRRELGTAKERLVLAVLLLNPGRLVTTETLIDHVWDIDPPAKPRTSLQSYVSRLRDRLAQAGGTELKSRSGGYVLEIDETVVDVHRFRHLRAQARAIADSGDEEHALELYRTAAQLWRAEPLADLSGDWVSRTRTFIMDQLLAATGERVDMELRHGRHADLVEELSDLVARFPLNEELVARLMRTLYCCGRQAEALEIFRRTRVLVLEEYGADPDAKLQEMHRRILEGDRTLVPSPRTRFEAEAPPNTLPRDILTFTGRLSEMRELVGQVRHQGQARESSQSAVNVIAIDGMPGVGKTALAVHLAHELASHYPDGQLFLNLHTHDAGAAALDPVTALGTLLQCLGVTPPNIPPNVDGRAALWRTQLARRRALIVLDDVAGTDQLLPLLPGSPGCLTIVTSRRRLVGLDDVRSLSLGVLPLEDAATLFANVAGADRPMDPKDVTAVIQRCGHLPLGIQLAGSKLRQHGAWTVAELLARLPTDHRRLDELRASDRAVIPVFEMSYRELSPRQQEAFRLFGLHPGPALTAPAAAALVHVAADEAERMLDDLHERHLLDEPAPGRFSFHDLLHDFSVRLAEKETSAAERRVAIGRLLDFYLAAADHADRLLYPQRRRIAITVTYEVPASPFKETKSQAQRWLTAEFDNLLGAANHAAQHGWASHTAHLGHVLAMHLESRGYWVEAAGLHERAVAAWGAIGDPTGMAAALGDLSHIRFRSGQYDDALEDAEKALALHRSAGNRTGEAEILDHIGEIRWQQSRFSDALTHCEAALRIWRSSNDRRSIAKGLDHSAIYLEYLGRYQEASSRRKRALRIYAEIGDLRGQQMALNNSGDLLVRLGDLDGARKCYEEVKRVSPDMDRQHEAIWLGNMANIFQRTGRYDDALKAYRKILPVHQQMGDRRGEIEALIGIGSTFQCMGKYSEALIHGQRALDAARDISERYEETRALRCIATALLSSGRAADALRHFEEALERANQIGEIFEAAKALEGMGLALHKLNGQNHAAEYWRRALDLFEKLGVPEGNVVRKYLLGTARDALTE